MARGWESKSVESQQFEEPPAGGSARSGRGTDDAAREALERQRKRESLEMSRRRIERELASARSETQRTALRNALQYLDDELRKLG